MTNLPRTALILAAGFFALAGSARSLDATCSASLQPGQYSAASVEGPYSGLMREDGSIIGWDHVGAFALPEHVQADLLWFTRGSMTWNYALAIPADAVVRSVSYTAEIASECPGWRWQWPSDATLSINGVAVGTWTIPGDPGPEYGYAFQRNNLGGGSQYGWLTTWTVDATGTYLDARFRLGDVARTRISDVTVNDLGVVPGQDVVIGLSIPGTGGGFGLNLFGDTWGDYPVDPTVSASYSTPIEVAIDVKPGSEPNGVNLGSNGNVPVAILGSAGFDAATVDPASVLVGGAPVAVRPKGTLAFAMEDVNGDGFADMVVHVVTSALRVSSGTVDLVALTTDGARIKGSDTVEVVP